METDLFVIGGGPAGYNAAKRAAEQGMSVVLAEERRLGGVCLNEGCIPTKSLLYAAKIFDQGKKAADFGVAFDGGTFQHARAAAHKDRVVASSLGIISWLSPVIWSACPSRSGSAMWSFLACLTTRRICTSLADSLERSTM